MERGTGNTAHRNVISRTDSADSEWMRQEALYLITMIIVRGWQRKAIISVEEFDLIDAVMLEKYQPKIGSFLIE